MNISVPSQDKEIVPDQISVPKSKPKTGRVPSIKAKKAPVKGALKKAKMK